MSQVDHSDRDGIPIYGYRAGWASSARLATGLCHADAPPLPSSGSARSALSNQRACPGFSRPSSTVSAMHIAAHIAETVGSDRRPDQPMVVRLSWPTDQDSTKPSHGTAASRSSYCRICPCTGAVPGDLFTFRHKTMPRHLLIQSPVARGFPARPCSHPPLWILGDRS